MVDMLLWMLNISWKLLILIGGWLLLKAVVKDGSGTFKEILCTLGLAIRAGCMKLREWLIMKMTKSDVKDETQDTGTVT